MQRITLPRKILLRLHPNNPQSPFNPTFPQNPSSDRLCHSLPTTTARPMASATLMHTCSSNTSSPLSTISKAPLSFAPLSTSPISYSKNPRFQSLILVPQLGLASLSTWNGLRRNGVSISFTSLRFEKKRKFGGKGVFASLFGVGAPEALVVGVVALLVFGPKGLAELAKNMGKTLRAFQPTIKELQEVSRDFKSTLEKEIGLDELKNPATLKTASIPTLSSSPLSVAPPENSQAIETETATVASTEDSQETATPLSATTEDSQATPPALITEDSHETATPVATTTEDSQAVATPAVATVKESPPTISSVEEVSIGSKVGTAV